MSDLDVLIERMKVAPQKPAQETWFEESYPWDQTATPADISRTETALGFALPSSLVRMLTEVSNGGFGLGWGFRAASGEGYHQDAYDFFIQAHWEMVRGYEPGPHNWKWPDGIIGVIDAGCGMEWCLDCETEEIVFYDPHGVDQSDPDSFLNCFEWEEFKLQDWIAQWLDEVETEQGDE